MNQIENDDRSQFIEAMAFAKTFDVNACEKVKSEKNFPAFLEASMWKYIRPVGKHWVGIMRYTFTYAVVAVEDGDYNSPYQSGCRWCYHSEQTALNALKKWDENLYQSEPEGWHRHPDSGRRREYDDHGEFKEEVRY